MSHGVEVTRVCRQAPPVLRRVMVAVAWHGSLTTARLGWGGSRRSHYGDACAGLHAPVRRCRCVQ